jgi:hypothetical protein
MFLAVSLAKSSRLWAFLQERPGDFASVAFCIEPEIGVSSNQILAHFSHVFQKLQQSSELLL